jgi:hypothetical protein
MLNMLPAGAMLKKFFRLLLAGFVISFLGSLRLEP